MNAFKNRMFNNKYFQISSIIILFLSINIFWPVKLMAASTINFSDIISGPKVGNSDGAGGLTSTQHGAIITVWGNYSGAATKVLFKDSTGVTREAAHIYYEKKADGNLPGGPADLYSYHKMREVAFSIPASSANGLGQISLLVDGIPTSNTLPFTVRGGNIFFIRPTNDGGSDSKIGTWSAPWATLQASLQANKLSAGDIVYTVGVGSSLDVNIGNTASMLGTASNPYSVIVYPNTTSAVTGTSSAALRLWSATGPHGYWNFAKFRITTVHQAVSLGRYGRFIGNKTDGPQASPQGYAGYLAGSCNATLGDARDCSGMVIYGNEVFNYGKTDGTTPVSHHLYYLTNRSGVPADAYEIAWNYHHDNPVRQGIHVYDQTPCGGWSGALKIHHNVIKNQGGAAINLDLSNCVNTTVAFEVNNNIVVLDNDFSVPGTISTPGSAISIRTTTGSASTFKVYNNTFYGWNYSNVLQAGPGTTDLRNNIFIDTRNIAYVSADAPTARSNNLFYSIVNPALALSSWAVGSLIVDPLFVNPSGKDFSLKPSSSVRYSGIDTVMTNSPTDFLGKVRKARSVSIGAVDYDASPKNLKAIRVTP